MNLLTKTTNKPYLKCSDINLPTLNTYNAISQKQKDFARKTCNCYICNTKLENKKHRFIERKKNTHLLWVFVIGF
jgi:hypothetical protein